MTGRKVTGKQYKMNQKAAKRVKPLTNQSKRTPARMSWLQSIARPFSARPVSIPDEQTTFSGKAVSRYVSSSAYNALAGTATSHSFGFVIPAYPWFTTMVETSAGNGTLTDVTVAGTAYTTATATNTVPAGVPNLSSLFGSNTGYAGRIRATSIGVRVTYAGTELNRSGRITAGLAPANFGAFGVATTGTKLSGMSIVAGSVTNTYNGIHRLFSEYCVARVSDGVFEAIWKPAGMPRYQESTALFDAGNMLCTVGAGTAATTAVTSSMMVGPDGSYGAQPGQNVLVILVDGDTTPTAVVGSNVYDVEIIWHWEIIPGDKEGVAFELSESICDPVALSATVNRFPFLPVARYGTTSASMSGNALGGR